LSAEGRTVTERVRQLVEKGVARIWRDLERSYRLPCAFPEADRAEVDADFRDDFDKACEAGVEGLLEDYREIAEKRVRPVAYYLDKLAGAANKPRGRPEVKETRLTRADSTFNRQRRLRALAFVGERAILLLQALKGKDLTPPRRVLWKGMAKEWSAANPTDRLQPDALRKMFKRALVDPALRQQYVGATRAAWLGERSLRVQLAEMFSHPQVSARSDPALLASCLRDDAEGLEAIAAGLPRQSVKAKDLVRRAREVRAAAARLERKFHPK